MWLCHVAARRLAVEVRIKNASQSAVSGSTGLHRPHVILGF